MMRLKKHWNTRPGRNSLGHRKNELLPFFMDMVKITTCLRPRGEQWKTRLNHVVQANDPIKIMYLPTWILKALQIPRLVCEYFSLQESGQLTKSTVFLLIHLWFISLNWPSFSVPLYGFGYSRSAGAQQPILSLPENSIFRKKTTLLNDVTRSF